LSGGCFTNEPDADGYTNRSLQLAGGWRFSPPAALEVRALRADFETEFDGGFSNEMEGSQQVYSAKLDLAPSERVALAFRLGRNADLADNFLEGRYRSSFDTRRNTGGAQADISLGSGLLSTGVDWHRDEVTSTTDYVIKARTQKALFAQWQQTLGKASLQLAGRRDDDSQFGNEATGSLLWGFSFSETLRLTASAGTAFRAPSFNDLYFPGFGNPDLKPETSESLELGLRGSPSWGGWAASVFRTEVEQLIAFDPIEFIPVNINRARIDGLELSAEGELAGTQLRASATVLDARSVVEGPADGRELPRRPPRSMQIDADRSYGRFSLGASVFAASARFDDLGNFTRLPGYATVDLRFGWTLNADWSLQLSGNNLFDRRYETAAFYNQPGRTWLLGLRYSPR
jgi:vitamin B12 transporter